MRLISVFCFTLGTSGLAALPLSAQLLSSPGSVLSQSSRNCSSGIASADFVIGEIADEAKTGAAAVKLEMARNMMGEGDYSGCLTYIDRAMRALRAND